MQAANRLTHLNWFYHFSRGAIPFAKQALRFCGSIFAQRRDAFCHGKFRRHLL
jgi:hypothetical protein